jgi:hypothetical protein
LRKGAHDVIDALYVGLVVGFFVLTWGLVKLCERL